MFKKRRREGGLGEAFSAGEERAGEAHPPPQPQQQQQRSEPRQEEQEEREAGEDEPVERAKKRAGAGAGAAIQFSTSAGGSGTGASRDEGFASTRSAAPQEYGGGAFATVEIHASTVSDARAVAERVAATASASAAAERDEETASLSVYRGLSAAKASVRPKSLDDVRSAQTGPLRAPSNLRVTSVFDYKPDVCKDYKETGYCGYGDTCIYMHDRGEYKSGYELEKEWQAKNKLKAAALARGEVWKEEDGTTADGGNKTTQMAARPFSCHICRKPFTRPVETLCGHFFCQRCAFGAYAKSSKCAVCGAQTKGVFNSAEDKVRSDSAAAGEAVSAP
jgi:RING finger protein 113A